MPTTARHWTLSRGRRIHCAISYLIFVICFNTIISLASRSPTHCRVIKFLWSSHLPRSHSCETTFFLLHIYIYMKEINVSKIMPNPFQHSGYCMWGMHTFYKRCILPLACIHSFFFLVMLGRVCHSAQF